MLLNLQNPPRVFVALALGLAIALLASCSPAVDPLVELRKERAVLAEKPRRLIMNNDGCDILYFPRKEEAKPENFLKLRISDLVDKQVDSLFIVP